MSDTGGNSDNYEPFPMAGFDGMICKYWQYGRQNIRCFSCHTDRGCVRTAPRAADADTADTGPSGNFCEVCDSRRSALCPRLSAISSCPLNTPQDNRMTSEELDAVLLAIDDAGSSNYLGTLIEMADREIMYRGGDSWFDALQSLKKRRKGTQ